MLKLPSHIYYLLFGQAINLITAVLSVTVAAIVGLTLAPTSSYATIPYGLQFFAILISTLFFSNLMKKFGRYPVFLIGILFLFFSGLLGFFSLQLKSFEMLCLSHFCLGLFISTANFYRFAATDGLQQNQIPKATSMVISGGVIAAIVAPLLAINFEHVDNFPNYSIIYLILSMLSILLFFIISLWNASAKKFTPSVKKVESPNSKQAVKLNIIIIGILGGALGYYLMNLMMIVSSLHLKTSHSFHYASIAIQMHVLAMFLPSFFVAKIINRIGSMHTIILGFIFIALSSLLPILFTQSEVINLSLIILGIGWNFSYSGGSALIGSIKGENNIKIQGVNETGIALFATLGAFLPAPILSYLGWINTNFLSFIFSIVAIVMILLLNNHYKRVSYEKN